MGKKNSDENNAASGFKPLASSLPSANLDSSRLKSEKQRAGSEKNSYENTRKKARGQKLEARSLIHSPFNLIAGCLLLAAFLWSYWPNITDLWGLWMRSDEFSAGLLVPFLALYILWTRRERFEGLELKPALIAGTAGLLLAQFVRLFGTFYMFGSLERFSIVLNVCALVLMVCGWKYFRKAFWVLMFLFLMLPWPNQVQARITNPLQTWATASSVFSLELIGYDVVREGNIIRLGDTVVAVAEACNGLRMITAFFVIIGLIVLLVHRPKWQKLFVFATCLPIALLCNTIRLTITAIAFTYLEGEHWQTIFHDFGGYAMMPLALAIAVGEFALLKALTTPPEEIEEEVVVRQASSF